MASRRQIQGWSASYFYELRAGSAWVRLSRSRGTKVLELDYLLQLQREFLSRPTPDSTGLAKAARPRERRVLEKNTSRFQTHSRHCLGDRQLAQHPLGPEMD